MNLDRVSTLLANGLPPAQVATIVGVTPARISQLLKEPAFETMLAAKMAETEKVDIEEKSISNKYLAAEHALINQVMELAPTAEMRDVVGALRVVSERQEKMKSRTTVQAPVLHQQLTVVSVNLPAHALRQPTVTFNSAREVVSIEDRPLAPMNSEAVIGMFNRMNKKGDSHEPLPSSANTEAGFAEVVPSSAASAVQVMEAEGFLAYAGR